MLPLAATVVALLFPLMVGATADNTALVATAGLFVRPLAATELSKAACADGAAIVGAAAGGGCGMSSIRRAVFGPAATVSDGDERRGTVRDGEER